MELGPCIPGIPGNVRQGPCHEQDGNCPMRPQLHMHTLVSMYRFCRYLVLFWAMKSTLLSAFTSGSVQLLRRKQHLREPQLSTVADDRGWQRASGMLCRIRNSTLDRPNHCRNDRNTEPLVRPT